MKSSLAALFLIAALSSVTNATPDCYDFSVTEKREDYMDMLPKLLFYGQVDWLKL